MQETDYFINPLVSVPNACALWFYCYKNHSAQRTDKSAERTVQSAHLTNKKLKTRLEKRKKTKN